MRAATLADAALLATIHSQCFEGEVWSADAIAGLLASPGTFALVTGDDSGFILVRVAGGESEVLTLGVAPAARRRGLATELVIQASNQAEKNAASVMFLEVNTANFAAIAVYKRLGFAEVGRRKNYYAGVHGVREDALVLRAQIPLQRVVSCMQLG